MTEINLLPDELRDREHKELKSARKQPKSFGISMSNPKSEKIDQPLSTARPSLLSRLFATKMDKPKMSEVPKTADILKPDFSFKKKPNQQESVFHIPKIVDRPVEKKSNISAPVGNDFKYNNDQKTDEIKRPENKFEITKKQDDRRPILNDSKTEKPKKKFKIFGFWGKKKNKHKAEINHEKEEKFKDKKDEEDNAKESFLDVDLIPRDLSGKPDLELKKKLFKSGSIVFLSLIIISLGYLGITWYKLRILQQKKAMEEEISLLNIQIAGYESEKSGALKIQDRVKIVRQLLDHHIYWTKFFETLQKHTLKDVYYVNFAMTGQDRLVISAVAKDYESIAKQLVAFEEANDFIKNVKIDALSANIDSEEGLYKGVNFNINLEFQPGVFLTPIE